MSTMTQNTSETSVTFSLAELAKLEEERVRQEDAQRARAREKDARERRDAEARARAAEAGQVAAEAEARARRVREEAADKVRTEARERAAMDVARIEAEARARLDADNAARAHELAVLRVRTEGGHRNVQRALAAVLGLVLCGGSAAAYGMTRHVEALEQDADHLRDGQQTLAREREHGRETELAALDRRLAALRARPLARGAEEASATADAAWSAIDPRAPDHARLRAFGDALDGLSARLETLDRLAALDRRQADLAAWAAERKRTELTTAARSAAARARALSSDEGALHAYEVALDQLRDALGQSVAKPGTLSATKPPVAAGSCPPDNPSCGLDGRRMW